MASGDIPRIGQYDPDDWDKWCMEDKAKYDNSKAIEAINDGEWKRAVMHLGRMQAALAQFAFSGENKNHDGKRRMKNVGWME